MRLLKKIFILNTKSAGFEPANGSIKTSCLNLLATTYSWKFPLSVACSKNVTFVSHHGGNYLLILTSSKIRDGTFMSLPAAKQIHIYQGKLGFLPVSHRHDDNVYYHSVSLALVLKLCDDMLVARRAVVTMYGAIRLWDEIPKWSQRDLNT